MNLAISKKITKNFIKNGEEFEPRLAGDWEFILVESYIFLKSKIADIHFYFSSIERYTKDYIFNTDFNLIDNKLQGNHYITSMGLIPEDYFYLATDFIENNNERLSQLEEGERYFSDKGKEYLYIGKITERKIFVEDGKIIKEISETKPYLYDLNKEKLVNSSSIKLVQFSENKEIPEIYLGSNSTGSEAYKDRLSKIEEVSFSTMNHLDLEIRRNDCINVIDIEEFFSSEENEIDLIKKPVLEDPILYIVNEIFRKKIIIDDINMKNKSNIYRALQQSLFHPQKGYLKNNDYKKEVIANNVCSIFTEYIEELGDIYNDKHNSLFLSSQGLRAIFKLINAHPSRLDRVKEIIVNYDWRDYKNGRLSDNEVKFKRTLRGSEGYFVFENELEDEFQREFG